MKEKKPYEKVFVEVYILPSYDDVVLASGNGFYGDEDIFGTYSTPNNNSDNYD